MYQRTPHQQYSKTSLSHGAFVLPRTALHFHASNFAEHLALAAQLRAVPIQTVQVLPPLIMQAPQAVAFIPTQPPISCQPANAAVAPQQARAAVVSQQASVAAVIQQPIAAIAWRQNNPAIAWRQANTPAAWPQPNVDVADHASASLVSQYNSSLVVSSESVATQQPRTSASVQRPSVANIPSQSGRPPALLKSSRSVPDQQLTQPAGQEPPSPLTIDPESFTSATPAGAPSLLTYTDLKIREYFDDVMKSLFFNPQTSRVHLRNTDLTECPCLDGKNNRMNPGNMRTKIETIILNHIKSNFGQSIRVLSLGSGGFLQDFIMVLNLLKAGHHSVHITMIEPSIITDSAYEDLKKQFNILTNKFPHFKLTYEKHYSINAIMSQPKNYDVLYAIDYEDYFFHDFSSRPLLEQRKRSLHFFETHDSKKNSYLETLDLMKAYTLVKDNPKSLAIFSRGFEIFSLTPSVHNQLKDYPDVSGFVQRKEIKLEEVSAFYANTNILHVIQNIEYLAKTNKLVFISENIVHAENQPYFDILFQKFHLNYRYIQEDDTATIEAATKRGLLIVLDYTTYDATNSVEDTVPPSLHQPNVIVIRGYDDQKKFNWHLFFPTHNQSPTTGLPRKRQLAAQTGPALDDDAVEDSSVVEDVSSSTSLTN